MSASSDGARAAVLLFIAAPIGLAFSAATLRGGSRGTSSGLGPAGAEEERPYAT